MNPEVARRLDAWQGLCLRCRVGGKIPVTFTASWTGSNVGSTIHLKAHSQVEDSGNKGMISILNQDIITSDEPVDPKRLARLAASLYEHELLEMFRLDGAPLFHPHDGDRL